MTQNALNNTASIFTVDNLQLDGNTLSSEDTDGDINLSPDGTGAVVVNTSLDVDNLTLDGNTLSSTNTNGNVILAPDGTGLVSINNLYTMPAADGTAGQVVTTNGAGVLSFASPDLGIWNVENANFNAAAENGYLVTATATATLPTGGADGDTIMIVSTSTDIVTVTANGADTINLGNAVTAGGGSISTTARGDSLRLVYYAAGNSWWALGGVQGNWTI